jgi:hypothetical protein
MVAEKEALVKLSRTTKSKEKARGIANLIIALSFLQSQLDKLMENNISSTQDFFWKSKFR